MPPPKDADPEESERRGSPREQAIPTHDGIDDETEARLMDLAGFDRADLYERRGPLTRRGLAHLLDPGDRIVDVQEDHVVVRRRDGPVQTFWNLRRHPHWAQPVQGSAEPESPEGGLAPPDPG